MLYGMVGMFGMGNLMVVKLGLRLPIRIKDKRQSIKDKRPKTRLPIVRFHV